MDIFSKRLKEERLAKNLTQRQMADLLGISQSTYKGYELVGETNGREPSIETIRLIVKILDISAGYLLGVEEI